MEPIPFKFKYLDDSGNEVGMRAKAGQLDAESLVLDTETIPVAVLMHAQRRFNRLIISGVSNDGGVAHIVFAVTSGDITRLQSALNQLTSATWSQRRKAHLEEKDQGHLFAVDKCSHCLATVDLSGMPVSEQLYCTFCDRLSTRGAEPAHDEAKYSICDKCGFFAQPNDFTIFYFYFLVYIYGWHSRKEHLCNTCMRSHAWKMLGGNLLFVIGVVPSIVQLSRAYYGGSARSRLYSGLDSANALAKKRKTDKAAAYYDAIEERLGRCAGVRYNHGMAYLLANRLDEATVQFQKSLLDCANYHPAYTRLVECYTRLGRTDAVEELHRLWGNIDDEEVTESDASSAAPSSG